MKLPRDLSGAALVAGLCRHWGYERIHQAGSHIIVQTESPRHHRIAIPDHPALRIGTLSAVLRSIAVAKGVDRSAILESLSTR